MANESDTIRQVSCGFPERDLEVLEAIARKERSKLAVIIRRIVGRRVDEIRAASERGEDYTS